MKVEIFYNLQTLFGGREVQVWITPTLNFFTGA
jgi:hypothetical protein